MNLTPSEGTLLVTEIYKQVSKLPEELDVDIVICPPFTGIDRVVKVLREVKGMYCGAQDCHVKLDGAFTGDISAAMLHEMGARYVILGHSERRKYYDESDLLVAEKIKTAIGKGLRPIYCCGEELQDRETGEQFEVVEMQVETALFKLTPAQMREVVIAYEPVWAIGTGKTASPEQAQEMHEFIRGMIAEQFGDEIANNLSILYGGSCKPENANSLFTQPDIDGGLIGGASLDADAFVKIILAY